MDGIFLPTSFVNTKVAYDYEFRYRNTKVIQPEHLQQVTEQFKELIIKKLGINEIDGRYIITNDSALATSIPSITILSGAELDELQQFLKSIPGN